MAENEKVVPIRPGKDTWQNPVAITPLKSNIYLGSLSSEAVQSFTRYKGGVISDGGGSSSDGGEPDMSDLMGRVSRLEHWFAAVVIGGLIIFAATAWALFSALSGRVDNVGDRVARVETSVERLDERSLAIQKQLDATDGKVDRIEEKIDRLIAR